MTAHSLRLCGVDHDRAKVIHVGQGRAGDVGSAQCLKDTVAVVIVQAESRVDPRDPGVRQASAISHSAG